MKYYRMPLDRIQDGGTHWRVNEKEGTPTIAKILPSVGVSANFMEAQVNTCANKGK